MLDAAKKYLSLGLNPVPIVRATKIPALDWKELQTRKISDAELAMFNDSSLDIGIITGKISKLFVLDLDMQHEYARAFLKGRLLPKTWSEKTKNGVHYYFLWIPELDKKKTQTRSILGEGVDTRGEGGLTKCSPSQNYSWIVSPFGNPLCPPPQWLVDLLPNKEASTQVVGNTEPVAESWVVDALNAIIPKDTYKGRTPTFLKVVNRLKAKGLTEGEVVAFLKPWADKHEYNIEKLVKDQYKRYAPPIQSVADSSDIEVFLQDEQVVEWLVPGLIASGSIGFVCGLPESNKTWMTMDLAIEMARGGLWLGKFQTKQGKVLFIDQERFKGETQRRLKALLKSKDISASILRDALFVKTGTTTRIDLQHSYEAFRKEVDKIRPDLIIVDSFVTFHSREENNRKDIQEVLERIKQLRNDFNCTFLFLDHEGKSSYHDQKEGNEVTYINQAGSIAKPAAAEFEFTVRRSEDGTMCYNTKNNLSTTAEPFLFKVEDLKPDKSEIQVRAY